MLVDGAFFTVLTPYFRPGRMLNIGPTRLGVLVSMYPLGGLVYGLVALAASIAGLRFGSQEWLLDASRFFGGVGASCVWTGGLSVLLHSSPANVRGRAISYVRFSRRLARQPDDWGIAFSLGRAGVFGVTAGLVSLLAVWVLTRSDWGASPAKEISIRSLLSSQG